LGIAAMASGAWQIVDPQGYAKIESQVRGRVYAVFEKKWGREWRPTRGYRATPIIE